MGIGDLLGHLRLMLCEGGYVLVEDFAHGVSIRNHEEVKTVHLIGQMG